MELRLTDEQKLAIESRAKQVIVTASAGAGKTFTMVNRVIDLILSDKDLSASDVIMLTFTEAAAADMRKKLEKAVFKRLTTATGEERTTLIRLLDTLPLLHCSTIDSFCFSFVKTHFEYLDLPPTISMVDEETAKSYREKAIKKVLEDFAEESLTASPSDADEYYRFLESFGQDEEDGLAKAIMNIYDFAETTEDAEKFLSMAEENATCSLDENPLIKDLVAKAAAKALETKQKIDNECIIPVAGATSVNASLAAIDEMLSALSQATTIKEVLAAGALTEFLPGKIDEREKKTHKAAYENWKVVKAIYSEWESDFLKLNEGSKAKAWFRKNYEVFFAEVEAARADTLTTLRLARRFKEEYAKIKREEEVLDFCDIEHLTLSLLKKDPSIVDEIGCKQLMMDESQDLNRLQEALMIKLKGKGDLYVVGDVKQSIYRFRLAAPELFNARVKAGEKDASAEVIRFDCNFRSSDAVIDFVNRVFGSLMTESFGGVNYTPASRGENHAGDGGVQCFFYRKQKGGEEGEVDKVYSVKKGAEEAILSEREGSEEAEARWVRDRIFELMRNPIVRDTEDGTPFKLSYKDITILAPIRMKPGSLEEKVVNCLRNAGIPVNIGGFVKDAFNDDVSSLVDFLRLLVSPRDDYALLSVLRSELFSFSVDDLARIALAEGDSFSEKAESLKEKDPKVKEVYDEIERYRILSCSLTLYELLSSLVEKRLRKTVLLRADGRKSFGEIMTFVENLKSGRSAESIPEFIDFFDNYYKMDFEGEVAEQNAVNFMTIHKSKGLEAPVVFVIGLGRQIVSSVENKDVVRMDNEYGVAKKTDLGKDVLFELFRLKKRKELKEDVLRLLYVALTRARNYLFLSGSLPVRPAQLPDKTKAEYCSQLILAGMGDYPYVSEYEPLDPSEREETEIKEPNALSKEQGEENLLQTIDSTVQEEDEEEVFATSAEEYEVLSQAKKSFRAALAYRYPHEEATKTGIKYTVTGINEMGKDKVLPVTRFFPEEAAAKGTAYHTVMEYVSFSMASVEEAAATLSSLAERGIITAEEKADISPKRLYEGVKKISEIVGGRKVYREKSFLLHVPAREAGVAETLDEVEVQGKVDLLAIGEDAVIVDYKLSAHTPEEIVETYRKQLSLYELAVRRSFNVAEVKKYIFVLGRNELIKL